MIVHWLVDGVHKDASGEYQAGLATNRYRAILPAKGLRDLGHQVELVDMKGWDVGAYTAANRPDVLVVGKLLPSQHSQQLSGRIIDGVAAAQRAGIKVIADVNDDHFQNPQLGAYWTELVRRVDGIVAGSQAMAETVSGYTSRPVHVVGDPVAAPLGEPKAFLRATGWQGGLQRMLEAMGSAPQRLRLAWYGNPVNWPSMASWIPALAKLAERQPWYLQVISRPGTGIETFVSGFNAARNGAALMEFVTWAEETVWEQVQDAHIVLIPSDLEDAGKRVKSANRLVDALNCGCFVIASPVPAYEAYSDCAWLGEDPSAGIEWAMTHPQEVSEMIARGQQRVAGECSLEAVAAAWGRAFERVGAQATPLSGRDLVPSARASATDTPIRLNLGCGDKILPGYINVDVVSSRAGNKPDVICDLRNLGSFADACADEILAVHVIEHFWRWEVEDLLKGWMRVLKPGGRLILECPNLASACRALLNNPSDAAEPDVRGRHTMWVFYGDPAWKDPLMCHRWGYTAHSLRNLLVRLGYVNVRQEPAQFKMREPRDMRIVGEKSGPAMLEVKSPILSSEEADDLAALDNAAQIPEINSATLTAQQIWDLYSRWFYDTMIWKNMSWHGIQTLKVPADMWSYQEIIFERKIEHVIETGTRYGGSALFFAETLAARAAVGPVISIDIDDTVRQVPSHPGVCFLIGDSASQEMVDRVVAMLPPDRGPVFLILDSDHAQEHVYAELSTWVPALKAGDYLIVEDTNINGHPVRPEHGPGPWEAVMEYRKNHPGLLEPDVQRAQKFGSTAAPDGFYIRI
ncbi:MAG: CmcI family methyltransferase [Pseudomonadota bacterium]